MVPKAISLTLVNHSKENLQRELLQELYKPEVLDELLKESDFVVSRRKEVQAMVAALNKAEEYVPFLFLFHFVSFLCVEFYLYPNSISPKLSVARNTMLTHVLFFVGLWLVSKFWGLDLIVLLLTLLS